MKNVKSPQHIPLSSDQLLPLGTLFAKQTIISSDGLQMGIPEVLTKFCIEETFI